MHTPVLSDEPSPACLLGRADLVAGLAHRAQTSAAPQVFGVFGDWGSGKTSFLHHVRAAIENERGTTALTLWFEAWKYSAEDRPVIALLQEMRRVLRWSTDAPAKAFGVLRKVVGSARRAAVTAAETGFEALTQKIGLNAKASDLRDLYADQLPTDIIREQLDGALETLLNARGKGRLIIFIDDLDRCHADAALRLLEGIKIYLNLQHCVFILGLNAREVQRGIEKILPGADDADHRAARAAEYLEKICTYPVRLTAPGAAAQETLINLWLRNPHTDKEVPGLGLPDNDALHAIAAIVRSTECLPPNPRKMKAWANALLQLATRRFPALVWRETEEPALIAQKKYKKGELAAAHAAAWAAAAAEAPFLVLAACLYTFHPEIHRRLVRNPALFAGIATWARQPGTREAHLALHGKAPDVSVADKDLLRTDLCRLEPTHRAGDHEMTDDLWNDNRRNYDPSFPQVFYCQRLLIHAQSIENSEALLKSWLHI